MDILSNGILVVDDELPIREMLEMVLHQFGYSVDTAENGQKAMEKIDHTAYDLIITDLKMPIKSGKELLEYVKAEKNLSVPVIGMSGTPWLLEHIGFDAVLVKPFLMLELRNLVKQVIRK